MITSLKPVVNKNSLLIVIIYSKNFFKVGSGGGGGGAVAQSVEPTTSAPGSLLVKLPDVGLGTCPRDSLVADEGVKKPTKQTKSSKLFRAIVFEIVSTVLQKYSTKIPFEETVWSLLFQPPVTALSQGLM